MSRYSDWRSYVDVYGNFEMPNFLYRSNTELMKQCLDFGTMITDDPVKLRAYKEQVKKAFRSRWLNVAEAFEALDLIEACGCREGDYCEECGGSRYRLSEWLTPAEIEQVSLFTSGDSHKIATMLEAGLAIAHKEVNDALSEVR
jgi:hypothetical protein